MKKSARQKVRPGPDGMLVVEPGFKLRGARRGTARKRSAKQLDALDVGRRTSRQDRLAVAETGRADAPAVDAAYAAAGEGDFAPLTKLSLKRAARGSMLYDAAVDAVEADGLILTEEATDSDGKVIASRKKIHPAADFALKSAETFGLTSEQLLTTPKARGVSKRDDALAAYIAQSTLIRDSLALNPITGGGGESVTVEVLKENPDEG